MEYGGPIREDIQGSTRARFVNVNMTDAGVTPNSDRTILSKAGPYKIANGYSDELKVILRRCIEYTPTIRPTMPELLALIYGVHPEGDAYWTTVPDLSGLTFEVPEKNRVGSKRRRPST